MQSQVSEISAVLVEVNVEVPWQDVKKELDGTYQQLGRTARVRGFRPGKVPRNVLRQLYGKKVKADVLQQVVERGLSEAVREHSIAVVAVPQLEETPEIKDGEALSFRAKMEVRPKIEQVDYQAIELTREPADVGDEQIDAELEQLRNQNAELSEPEPMRPAQEGDVLSCDYTVQVDGEDKPEMAASDRPIEISEGLLPAFREALLGKQPGDATQFELTFPDGHGELAGKQGQFSVEVKELKQKVLPDLDDEFAKDLGEHDTLEELRRSIRERLEKQAKERTDSALKEQLVDKLVDKNPIELPPSLVQQQQQGMLQEYLQILQMTGQAPQLGDDFIQDMQGRAERKVRAALLMGAIAQEQGIEASDEEVEQRLTQMAERTGKHVAKLRAEMQGEQRQMLESQVVEEKLLEYLLGQATIIAEPAEGGGD